MQAALKQVGTYSQVERTGRLERSTERLMCTHTQPPPQGVRRLEIEFPIQPGRIDVSLGEFLDESRDFVREFVRPFTTKGQKLWVVFPDGKVRPSCCWGCDWGGSCCCTVIRAVWVVTGWVLSLLQPGCYTSKHG